MCVLCLPVYAWDVFSCKKPVAEALITADWVIKPSGLGIAELIIDVNDQVIEIDLHSDMPVVVFIGLICLKIDEINVEKTKEYRGVDGFDLLLLDGKKWCWERDLPTAWHEDWWVLWSRWELTLQF